MFIRNFFIIFFLGMIALLFGSNLVLNKTNLNQQLIELIEEKIEKLTKASFNLGSLDLNLFLLKAHAEDISFSTETNDYKLALGVRKATARISPLGILLGEVRLSDVVIEEPKVDLKLTPSHETESKKPLRPRFDLKYNFINNLEIKDLSLIFEGGPKKERDSWKLLGLNLDLKAQRHRSISGKVTLQELTGQKGLHTLLNKLSLETEIRVTNNLFLLNDLNLSEGKAYLGGSIETVFLKNPQTMQIDKLNTQTKLSGKIDLKRFKPYLKEDEEASGSLAFNDYSQIIYDLKKQNLASYFSKGKLLSKKARFNNFDLIDSKVSYKVSKEKIVFEKITLKEEDHIIAVADGELAFSKNLPLDFNINITGSLQDIFKLFTVDNPDVNLFFDGPKIKLTGTANPTKIAIKGSTFIDKFTLKNLEKEVKAKHYASCLMGVDIFIDSEHMNFSKGTKGNCLLKKKNKTLVPSNREDSGDLHMKGSISFKKPESDLYFFSRDIPYSFASTFIPTLLGGHGAASVNIRSKDKKTRSLVTFSGSDVLLEKIPFLDAKGSLLFTEGRMRINHLTSYLNHGGLDASGTIDFNEGSFDLEAKSKGLTQEAVSKAMKHFFPGFPLMLSSGKLETKVKGKIDRILAAQGTLSAELFDVNWEEKTFFDKLSVSFERNHEKISLLSCKGALGPYSLLCEGELETTKQGRYINEATENFDIHSKDPFRLKYSLKKEQGTNNIPSKNQIPYLEAFLEEKQLSVEHKFKGTLFGSLEKPKLIMTGELKDLLFKKELKFSDLNYTLNADSKQLELFLQLDGGNLLGSINAQWTKRETPFKINLKLDQFDIRFLLPRIFHSDPRNFSYLSCNLDLEGTIEDRIRFSQADFYLQDFNSYYFYEFAGESKFLELSTQKPYRYSLISQGTKKSSESLTLKNQYIEMNLENFDSFLQDEGKLDITGTADLSLLSEVLPSIVFSKGKAAVKGYLSFDKKGLQYSLNMKNRAIDKEDRNLKSASLLIPGIEPIFENIIFDVDYTNGLFKVNHFFSEKGEGSINLGGTFALNKQELKENPLLTLDFNNASFNLKTPYLKEIETSLSGKLFIKEKSEPYQIYGDISVDRLNSNMSYNFTQEAIRSLQKRQLTQSLSDVTGGPLFLFDINVKSDKSISINNNTINLIASGDVKVLGSSKSPALSGLIRTESGSFRYKRDFEIERCFIYFDEGDSLDPSIDIKASSFIDYYKVSLNILGRASNPLVDFDISPQISREDNQRITSLQIMYLISQGNLPRAKTTILSNDLFSYDQNIMASLNYATEILPFEILDNFFGNDFIYLRPEFSDVWGDGSFFTVSTLVNLRKDLNIKVQTSPNLSRASFSIEYQFNNHIKSLLDFKVGDKRNDVKRRYQSFNLKFNFPF